MNNKPPESPFPDKPKTPDKLEYVTPRFLKKYISQVIKNARKAFGVVIKKESFDKISDYIDSPNWMKPGWRNALHTEAMIIVRIARGKHADT